MPEKEPSSSSVTVTVKSAADAVPGIGSSFTMTLRTVSVASPLVVIVRSSMTKSAPLRSPTLSYRDNITSSTGATKVNDVSRQTRLWALGRSPLPEPAIRSDPAKMLKLTLGSQPLPLRLALASQPLTQYVCPGVRSPMVAR